MAEKLKPYPTYVHLAGAWREERNAKCAIEEFTYDDFIIHPQRSVVSTLDEIDLTTELVKGITLKIPIVSANMDTVTEAPMAILMARVGGIGIIHRAMKIEEQVNQIKMVKDAIQFVVENPPKISPLDCVEKARRIMDKTNRGYVLVTDDSNKLLGLVTSRDLKRFAQDDWDITKVMTPRENIIVAEPGVSMEKAQEMMYEARIEKLPLINSEGYIAGVITDRDLNDIYKYPLATKDEKGRLRVGVAIGVDRGSVERAEAAIDAGADLVVIDVLHGDSDLVEDTVKKVKRLSKTIPVIAGNVAGASSTKRLIEAGADGVKVGYGPGAVCTTRLVTGTGMPQFSAVVESSDAAYSKKTRKKIVTINADGNIRKGGDIAKALAGGADHVMIGSLLAGTDESPGEIIIDDITKVRSKRYDGMASGEKQVTLAQAAGKEPKKRAPQGTSIIVPYVGSAEKIIDNLVGGVISGIANAGAKDIKGLQEIVSFGRQTQIGYIEGTPHGRSDFKT
jgi:IMP dehydrogenase